jgi:spoIIIJ-associated protein
MSAYESSGKTVEEAITAGLEKLNLSIGEVQVDILDEGSKGLFGLFGSKLARVRLTVKEVDEADSANVFAGSLDRYDASQASRAAEIQAASEKQQRQQAQPQRPPVQPPRKPLAEKPAAARPAARIMMDEEEAPERTSRAPRAPRPPRAKAAAPAAPDAPMNTGDLAAPMISVVPARPVVPAVQLDSATLEGNVQRFVQELTQLMSVNVSVSVRTDEEGNIRVNMEGDPLGILIGRRGETLDAMQYITALFLNRGKDTYTRVTLDSEGYRAKREDALIRLANRMASRAVKTGRRVTMEPMNPYERRILHSALQNHPGIATHSEGEEPNRHVVITLAKEGADAAQESQG